MKKLKGKVKKIGAKLTGLRNKKVLTLLAVLAAAVVLIGGSFIIYKIGNKSSRKASDVCTSNTELIKQLDQRTRFKPAVSGTAVKQFIDERVRPLKDYRADINCIYPITINDIHNGDITSAQEDYETYKSLQANGQQLSELYKSKYTNQRFEVEISLLLGRLPESQTTKEGEEPKAPSPGLSFPSYTGENSED